MDNNPNLVTKNEISFRINNMEKELISKNKETSNSISNNNPKLLTENEIVLKINKLEKDITLLKSKNTNMENMGNMENKSNSDMIIDEAIPHHHTNQYNNFIPEWTMEIKEDMMVGYHIIIRGLDDFFQQGTSMVHIPGKGHAHLYINGDKVTRLYSGYTYINKKKGDYEFKATLSSNDHAEYVDAIGMKIQKKVKVTSK